VEFDLLVAEQNGRVGLCVDQGEIVCEQFELVNHGDGIKATGAWAEDIVAGGITGGAYEGREAAKSEGYGVAGNVPGYAERIVAAYAAFCFEAEQRGRPLATVPLADAPTPSP
jgi:hypothetical protein